MSPERLSVPWSSGVEPPALVVPANAIDCHHHIYDHRFPVDPHSALRPGVAGIADYRLLQRRLGIGRHVLVQPSTYGLDNSGLVWALGQFGLAEVRGVAVVTADVAEAELDRLDAAGVRGVRVNLVNPGGATALPMVPALARRIADRGWHLQLYIDGDRIVAHRDLWPALPCPVVFDHLGRIPQPDGVDHPAFTVIGELLAKDRAWVKLSGFYMVGRIGAPTFADASAVAKAYVAACPGRLVWGSDWPHATEPATAKPDDAAMLDLLGQWTGDPEVVRAILVDNPARLYGF